MTIFAVIAAAINSFSALFVTERGEIIQNDIDEGTKLAMTSGFSELGQDHKQSILLDVLQKRAECLKYLNVGDTSC